MNTPDSIERPAPLATDAGPFHKLQHMVKMQHYRLYRIQQAQKMMEKLADELVESSASANLIRQVDFRAIEMAYLSASRSLISIQSNLVSPADIQKEGNLD